uniref:Uncharacterized protein n=1 Tax=Marmota marmota marmota TaxID=9994 RepID=A0A8C5Z891_MARMA
MWDWWFDDSFICCLIPVLLVINLSTSLPRPGETCGLPDSLHGPDCSPSPHQGVQLLIEGALPWWVAALCFPIASKEVFESVATLLQCPQEAQCTQPLCNGPIHLAVLVTGAKLFREWGLTENCQEGLGLLIAPVHTCCQERRVQRH